MNPYPNQSPFLTVPHLTLSIFCLSAPDVFDKLLQVQIKHLGPYRHLRGVKRILHDEVAVNVVYATQSLLNVRMREVGNEEEFSA
ncbi:hypothetical protein BC938DRAFT_474413 [Jimgerdemannia flammicorona]|uniref:Uncharacterized protein n=1 Tax=Jimgerdemannia flammicorona TaxID=994334 RepID=A0A433Q2D4_9FUNG|nr:hypothetical protein BC938DRAFT_474413 [Jimgerdemannia flammicorona]